MINSAKNRGFYYLRRYSAPLSSSPGSFLLFRFCANKVLPFSPFSEGGRGAYTFCFLIKIPEGSNHAQEKPAPHIPYNKSVLEKAREIRNQLTPPERQFWNALRSMPSYKDHPFNRQKPLGEYIVDFYCHEYRLIVEIDGDTHGTEEAQAKDQRRTAFLESNGLRVVRFTNREVLNNIEGVMESLENLLNEIKEEAP